jgi:hypothetical protein
LKNLLKLFLGSCCSEIVLKDKMKFHGKYFFWVFLAIEYEQSH